MAATCKACGAPLVWIETPKGKWIPCDEGIVEFHRDMCGKDIVVCQDGSVVRCSLDFSGPATGTGRIPHWATCPSADKFRRKRGEASQ